MKKKLLLHSCCAPCSTAVIDKLKNNYAITVFYYNPNIFPEAEYVKRKAEQIRYIRENLPEVGIAVAGYDTALFNKAVAGFENEKEGGARCKLCFYLRLSRTAEYCKTGGFDIFATTLSVSPHKNFETLTRMGENLAKVFKVEYLNEDFKKDDGYKKSVEMSKKFNLYRQNYCGCKYSMNNDTDKKSKH